MTLSRRSFLTLLGSTAAAAIVKPVVPAAEPNIVFSMPEKLEFFDIITYTGNGGSQHIQYNLGWNAQIMIFKKRIGEETNWLVKKLDMPWEEAKTQDLLIVDNLDLGFKEYDMPSHPNPDKTFILRPTHRSPK